MERNKFFSICSTPGVEYLYSKILLRNGVERSSGVGVDPYTQYKTDYQLSWFEIESPLKEVMFLQESLQADVKGPRE